MVVPDGAVEFMRMNLLTLIFYHKIFDIIVACRFLLGFGRLISYHRNRFAGRTSIIARLGEAAE